MDQLTGCLVKGLVVLGLILAVCIAVMATPVGEDILNDPVFEDALPSMWTQWGAFTAVIPEQYVGVWEEQGWVFAEGKPPAQLEGWVCMPSTSGVWWKTGPETYVGCCFRPVGGGRAGCEVLLKNGWYGTYSGTVERVPWWAHNQSNWYEP